MRLRPCPSSGHPDSTPGDFRLKRPGLRTTRLHWRSTSQRSSIAVEQDVWIVELHDRIHPQPPELCANPRGKHPRDEESMVKEFSHFPWSWGCAALKQKTMPGSNPHMSRFVCFCCFFASQQPPGDAQRPRPGPPPGGCGGGARLTNFAGISGRKMRPNEEDVKDPEWHMRRLNLGMPRAAQKLTNLGSRATIQMPRYRARERACGCTEIMRTGCSRAELASRQGNN